MTTFRYQALNEKGEKVTGSLEADSELAAVNTLASRGYIPTNVSEQAIASPHSFAIFLKKTFDQVDVRALKLFTKQMKSMLSAGIPVVNTLKVLEAQAQDRTIKKVLPIIINDILAGKPMYLSFKAHPHVFSDLYCNMLQAGETSGNLPKVLDRLTYLIEHESKIRSDIRSALQYPVIVIIALVAAFFLLLTFVVPKFAGIFAKAKFELPLPTKICIGMHYYLTTYWFVFLIACIGIVFGITSYLRTENGKLSKDRLLLNLPIVGELFTKAAMSRFASIFAILQSSGVSLLSTISIITDIIGNRAIAQEFIKIREKIERGQGISGPLKTAKYFTPMIISMVAVGEETGNIDEMLNEVSKHYDEEVEYGIKNLSESINPILISGLAIVVGFFALAIFLPMWELTQLSSQR